jgi:hypothetical protein
MLKVIEVVFDGKAFVPTEPVDLPAGTKANVELPEHGYPGPPAGAPDPDNPPTPEQEAVWIEFMRAIRSSPPDPPTFDEYLRQRRGES